MFKPLQCKSKKYNPKIRNFSENTTKKSLGQTQFLILEHLEFILQNISSKPKRCDICGGASPFLGVTSTRFLSKFYSKGIPMREYFGFVSTDFFPVVVVVVVVSEEAIDSRRTMSIMARNC
mmetsp:Transcript_29343/g.44418  ORF Transcript_29343/g.44418 Transcript_29343/m.44418 type:complete len:121 (-) Transcript_29343:600-962(-)